jgi:hypothetical protein
MPELRIAAACNQISIRGPANYQTGAHDMSTITSQKKLLYPLKYCIEGHGDHLRASCRALLCVTMSQIYRLQGRRWGCGRESAGEEVDLIERESRSTELQ